MPYSLSRKADEDIRAIYRVSVVDFGIDQAERYLDGLIQAMSFLAEFPLAARERTELKRPVRVYRYESHIIFYRRDRDGIFIQRIRHGREDWLNHR